MSMQAIVRASRYSYSETVTRLGIEIARAGAMIFCKLDLSASAKSAGLRLRFTTLVIFGTPKMVTDMLEASPLTGLDLPLKVLVWDDDGAAHVAYVPAHVMAEHGTTETAALVAAMDDQLERLVATVSV